MYRKKDQLTGGTGDVNPQMLLCSPTISVGGTTTQVVLPTQRLPSSGRAQVLEILKIFVSCDQAKFNSGTAAGLATQPTSATIRISSRNPGSNAISATDTSIIADMHVPIAVTTVVGATPTYLCWANFADPLPSIDLTDGAGHGYVVGTDSIFLYGKSNVALPIASDPIVLRIYYRWKDISLAEYVGMVQQQA